MKVTRLRRLMRNHPICGPIAGGLYVVCRSCPKVIFLLVPTVATALVVMRLLTPVSSVRVQQIPSSGVTSVWGDSTSFSPPGQDVSRKTIRVAEILRQVKGAQGHLGELRPELERLLWERISDLPLQQVEAKAGGRASIALFTSPVDNWPTVQHSLAVLVVKGKVIDWASYWMIARLHRDHTMSLEDVDRDGHVDLAFRLTGDGTPPIHAYRIALTGLESILPIDKRTFATRLFVPFRTDGVRMWATGFPRSLTAGRLVRFTVHAENHSTRSIPLDDLSWFNLRSMNARYTLTSEENVDRTILRAGMHISSTVNLILSYDEHQPRDIEIELALQARGRGSGKD